MSEQFSAVGSHLRGKVTCVLPVRRKFTSSVSRFCSNDRDLAGSKVKILTPQSCVLPVRIVYDIHEVSAQRKTLHSAAKP